jgi:CheY-like chemotaxis protein
MGELSPMARILHVGTNDAVMATRRAILKRAGHEVTLAHDLREVLAACTMNSFDVVILGQALRAEEKQRVVHNVLERCKPVRFLEYHNGISPDMPSAHAHLQVASSTPQSLVQSVEYLAADLTREKEEQS